MGCKQIHYLLFKIKFRCLPQLLVMGKLNIDDSQRIKVDNLLKHILIKRFKKNKNNNVNFIGTQNNKGSSSFENAHFDMIK